jgi:hypothetical protein
MKKLVAGSELVCRKASGEKTEAGDPFTLNLVNNF